MNYCKINGTIFPYDICSSDYIWCSEYIRSKYTAMYYPIYLGCGTIVKVDGITRYDTEKLHFWQTLNCARNEAYEKSEKERINKNNLLKK